MEQRPGRFRKETRVFFLQRHSEDEKFASEASCSDIDEAKHAAGAVVASPKDEGNKIPLRLRGR